MKPRPTHLPSPAGTAAMLAAVCWLAAGSARAADRLPQAGSRQTLDIVSASYIPEQSPAAQTLSPAAPHTTPAVDCVNACPPGFQATWKSQGPAPDFQQWGQGEYVGRARLPHVPVYRLRADDRLNFDFRVSHEQTPGKYKLGVGDELRIESAANLEFNRRVIVLPDGTITLPLIGRVPADGSTVAELRERINEALVPHVAEPSIDVLPTRINSKLEELRYAISGEVGFAAQVLPTSVTPEGTIQLPAVGVVPAQGLTLDELRLELTERFAEKIEGIEVVPVLQARGPRYVYVLGEVAQPGRYTLEAPTTVMQAISMAGSWTIGAHIDNVVVFRRGDDWQLVATKLDLTRALLGKEPCPDGEIWVSDSDLVIVPKSKLLRTTNFIELVFTRGVYGVLPVSYSVWYNPFKGTLPFLPIP